MRGRPVSSLACLTLISPIAPRGIRERTRSVLGGVTTQSVVTIIINTDRAHAPRGHAARDAPRHRWHRLHHDPDAQIIGKVLTTRSARPS